MKELTDKDGLDRSYAAENDLSNIGNTVYIARTHVNRASDLYDDFFKVPSLWNAVPIVNHYKSLHVWYGNLTIYRRFSEASG